MKENDSVTNPASRAQILASRASRGAVKSREYIYRLPDSRTAVWSPRIPFQTLFLHSILC